jgi:hypothetical protein
MALHHAPIAIRWFDAEAAVFSYRVARRSQ